jgi:glutamate-ammonia-ligase adenylyltransferase
MDKLPDPRWQDALQHSRYLSNLLAANPTLMPDLAAAWTAPLSEDILREATQPRPLATTRRSRHNCAACASGRWRILRYATCAAWRRWREVVESMTMLADVTTNFALDHYHRQLVTTYGEPLDRPARRSAC